MNSVHEPGPNSDLETVVHQVHSLLAQQHTQVCTGVPRRAHAWPCRGRYGRVVAMAPDRVAGTGRRVAALGHRIVAECRARLWLCHGRVSIQPTAKSLFPWSQYTEVYCDTITASSANMPPLSRYRLLYRDTVFFPFWSQYT